MIAFVRATMIASGLIASTAAAQRTEVGRDTVTVTQRVLVAGDVTPAEAKRQGLEKALAEAVRRISGVRVQSAQLGVGEDRAGRVNGSFLSVIQLDASGRATNYRVLDERYVTERHAALGPQVYYELSALVTVEREIGALDPGFTVQATLNDALFFDAGGSLEGNDEVVATISTSRDAWLTVFSVTGDSAELLMPNAVMGDARMRAGTPAELPSREWRERGVHFRAVLPPQAKARHELLVIVATRSPVSFPVEQSTDGTAKPISLMSIQRWLVTIPLEQRAMTFAAYEVRRK
jgi:hypothetical protein